MRKRIPIPAPTPVEVGRFWSHVDKGGGDDCWVWLAHRIRHRTLGLRYGVASIAKRGYLAHRVAWTIANGAIPAGLDVLHSCDNPGCVRPDHLFLGTHADNMRDMRTKGRGRPIEKNKVSVSDVVAMRAMRSAGASLDRIADAYPQVSPRSVRDIVNGRVWARIPGAVKRLPRLSAQDVRLIRSSDARGIDLAGQYGVSPSVITRVRNGEAYRDVA